MVFSPRSGSFLLVPLLAALIALPTGAKSVQAGGAFELLGSSRSRVTVSFKLPGWSLEPVETGAGVFFRVFAPSGEVVPRDGYPELPSFKTVVAVPAGSRITPGWNVTASRSVRCEALLPVQRAMESEDSPRIRTTYADEIEASGGYSPLLVEVTGPMRLRDFFVAEITIRPFSWDRVNGTLRVTESLEVSLDLAFGAPDQAAVQSSRREKIYETIYESTLLNYSSASAWRIAPAGIANRLAAAGPFEDGGQWLKISIDSSGMYVISAANLAQADVELATVDPATLRLYTGGNGMLNEDVPATAATPFEVAIAVEDGGDGQLGGTDRIVFYGRAVDRFVTSGSSINYERHRYETRGCYWLTWGGAPGAVKRIPSQSGTQTGAPLTSAERWLHFEDNTSYLALETQSGDFRNPAPDYWGWVLDADESGIASRTFSLPVAPPGSAWLRFQIYGRGLPHPGAWSVSLNGTILQSGSNIDMTAITSPWLPVPQGTLNQALNSFTLAAQGHYLGWFEIRAAFPLELGANSQLQFNLTGSPVVASLQITSAGGQGPVLYEISDYRSAVRVTSAGGGLFHAPIDARATRSFVAVAGEGYRKPTAVVRYQPANLGAMSGAEYVVIAPKVLIEQAGELASLRQERYSTAVVAVEDIYAEYALGLTDPAAVRNFLYDAFVNWPVRPLVVVLFGDGHTDYRGVTQIGQSRPNLVPPYVDTSDIAVEEWFTRFDTTGLPQIALGRIPVKTATEAELIIDKISAYEEGRDAGEWSRRALLVADDGYVLGRNCDYALNHVPGSEIIDSLLPRDVVRRKIYLDAYPFDPPEIGTRKPEANQDLITWWNRGALLINYLGHGSNIYWAQERVFDGEQDVALLNNGYRLPLVLNSSCSIGHFDDYREEAMAERILLKSGGGAIAVFAGTRVTYAFQNLALNQNFVNYLFSDSEMPLGAIHLASRIALQSSDRGNAKRYGLFGDPALILHKPSRGIKVSPEPGGQIKPGGKVDFSGTVDSPGGGADGSFSGVARVKFLLTGSPVDIAYQCAGSSGQENRNLAFERSSTVLFDGPVTVAGGVFSGSFVLPLSLNGEVPADSMRAEGGLFSAYATSEEADAAGAGEKITLPAGSGTSSDSSAPVIRVLSAGRELADGDRVSRDKPLVLALSDESGINTTGRPGEQLTVEVDGGNTWSADLTELFSYERDSYQQGTVEVMLNRVPDGLHSFRFRAVDNALNTSRVELMLNVAQSGGGLALSQVLNYPNPFSETTSICFEVSQPADIMIRIFTVAGRPVKQLRAFAPTAGFQAVEWNGTDEYQQKVANGVYLYKITCKSTGDISSSEEVEVVGKALLSR